VLNVWAPANATDLPVFVYIRESSLLLYFLVRTKTNNAVDGGGYDTGSSSIYDVPFMVKSAKDKFIGVAIQYRVCASNLDY
jgi:carboxylesterase type B